MAFSLALLGASTYEVPVASGSYDLLATEILTSSQSSITFSSLDSTYGADYQHLQIRLVGRSDSSQQYEDAILRFNGDTGSNYSTHGLTGTGSSVVSNANTSQTSIPIDRIAGGSSSSNIFGTQVIDILDAFETTKYKTTRSLGGYYVNVGRIDLRSGLWQDTDAIDSILIDPTAGSNLVSGTRISLYGLKAGA
jgi:hypothetical protein